MPGTVPFLECKVEFTDQESIVMEGCENENVLASPGRLALRGPGSVAPAPASRSLLSSSHFLFCLSSEFA